MSSGSEQGQTYAALADAYARRGEPGMRDRFLVLAADAALSAGQANEAEKFRRQLLQFSPHHLLKPYASFAEASQAPDLAAYIQDLRENYPAPAARQLLASMPPEGSPSGDSGSTSSSSRRRAAAKSAAPLDSTQPPAAPEPPIYRLREVEPPRDPDLAATLPPGKIPVRTPAASAKPRVRAAREEPESRPRAMPRPLSPSPRKDDTPNSDELTLPEGSWLSALLFGIVATAALAWLAYTLGRPFLP